MTAPAETPAYSPFLDNVQAFEQAVLAQERVTPEHYDDEYFAADWREEGNRYELETRRRVEDRNPALIKEVFEPARVLDVGCGPGFLMLFLAELGIEVEGIDFSPSSHELAPPELRAAILRGWVCPIVPCTPRPSSRQILGSWVVLPDPVSPATTTT